MVFVSGRGGQVMLITILALSATILGATTIAGLLMLYQVRQSTDIVSSTRSVFAADTGIEWRLYKFFKTDSQTCHDCPEGDICPQPQLSNNSTFQATCESVANTAVTIRSTGNSANTSRAFEITLER